MSKSDSELPPANEPVRQVLATVRYGRRDITKHWEMMTVVSTQPLQIILEHLPNGNCSTLTLDSSFLRDAAGHLCYTGILKAEEVMVVKYVKSPVFMEEKPHDQEPKAASSAHPNP